MSTPRDLMNEVLEILRVDDALCEYVSRVYARERDSLDEGARVNIMVEPYEVEQRSPQWPGQEICTLMILGWVVEPSVEMAGDGRGGKQVLDLAHDIKCAIEAEPTLDGNCDSHEFQMVRYHRRRGTGASLRQPPVYGVEMFLEIFYCPTRRGGAT